MTRREGPEAGAFPTPADSAAWTRTPSPLPFGDRYKAGPEPGRLGSRGWRGEGRGGGCREGGRNQSSESPAHPEFWLLVCTLPRGLLQGPPSSAPRGFRLSKRVLVVAARRARGGLKVSGQMAFPPRTLSPLSGKRAHPDSSVSPSPCVWLPSPGSSAPCPASVPSRLARARGPRRDRAPGWGPRAPGSQLLRRAAGPGRAR